MINKFFNKIDLYFNKYRLRRILLLYIPGSIIYTYLLLSIYETIYNNIYML